MTSSAETPRRRLTGAIVPALAAAGLAGLATLLVVGQQQGGAGGAPVGCVTHNLQAIGGPLNLIDVRGRPVTQTDITVSGPSVVYFGFTRCPDACPTTLYALGRALESPGGFDIQPVFITLDPERDTPQVMDQYAKTNGFPAGLMGLTGSADQVRAAAAAFKVAYSKTPTADGDYTIDHTSFLYVMNAAWRTVAIMPTQGATPQSITACIAAGLHAS